MSCPASPLFPLGSGEGLAKIEDLYERPRPDALIRIVVGVLGRCLLWQVGQTAFTTGAGAMPSGCSYSLFLSACREYGANMRLHILTRVSHHSYDRFSDSM